MASDSIVVLASYYEPVAAHLARTRLEAAGIACFLSNENMVSLNLMYSPAAGGIRLHVYQRDAERAAEALQPPVLMQAVPGGPPAPDAEAPTTETPTTCPRCHSAEVAHDAAATPGEAHWWPALLSRLRRYPLQGKASHCFHCGLNF